MTESKFWNRNFIKVASANLLLALPFYVLTIILPLYIKQGLGVPEQQIGTILAMYSLAAVLMRPITGYLLDNFNRKTIYLLGFALYTLCILIYPFISGAIFIGLLRFTHGLGWGGINTSGSTLAIDFVPKERRGEGIGIYGMSMTIATMTGPLFGTFLLKQTGDFLTVFLISFAISAVAFTLGSTLKIPFTPKKRSRFSVKNIFSRQALPSGILALCNHIPYGFVMGFIALYASTMQDANSGIFFAIYALTAFIARYLAGRLFDIHGPKWLVPFGVLLTALGFVALALFPHSLGLYLSAIPVGLGFGTLMNVTQSMANYGVSTEERGKANATYLMLFDIGIGLGMLLFGQIIGHAGYTAALYTSVGILICSLFIFYLYALPAHRRQMK